jgi:Pyruvate/2-oxoacid:ferredoxin oxidoreductase gamma subunit
MSESQANSVTLTQRPKPLVDLDAATVRFCGDSGDGMQLAGTQLTSTSAVVGNDVATFPDYPAEIRAPRGTKAGVSGFQIHFASRKIFTPGDQVDALVAMNPAALVTNIQDLVPGGILIVDRTCRRPAVRPTRSRTGALTAITCFASTSPGSPAWPSRTWG